MALDDPALAEVRIRAEAGGYGVAAFAVCVRRIGLREDSHGVAIKPSGGLVRAITETGDLVRSPNAHRSGLSLVVAGVVRHVKSETG
jgi:hypothetical protein